MKLGPVKNVIIKTYTHESGLFYLGCSLAKELEKQGYNIFFIPKSKYIKNGQQFKKTYLESDSSIKSKVLPMSVDLPISGQILEHIKNNKIGTLISMETLMESSSWLGNIKRKTNVRVIDVPMLEWVSPHFLDNKAYSQFDEIWAITNLTERTFNKFGYPQTKRIFWNFVDEDIYCPNINRDKNPSFIYYHQGSLNPDHSSKNTLKVLQAFEKMLEQGYRDIILILTGRLNETEEKMVLKYYSRIKTFDRILSRDEVANIYKTADCVVAPSSKEGLGLSLFEAQACGCELITTDAPPMNDVKTKYLCQVSKLINDKSLVPIAEVTVDSIYQQMKKVYEDKNV